MTFAMVCPCASPPMSVRRIIMSKVPLSISLLDWFFLGFSLSSRSSMERDNIPLELLWEETCESTLAVIGQLAITGQRAHPEGLKVKSQVQVGYTDISSRFHETSGLPVICAQHSGTS